MSLQPVRFTCFQTGFAVSRYLGDYLTAIVSRKLVAFAASIVAAIGSVAVALASVYPTESTLIVAIFAFVLVGFASGPVYPVVLSYLLDLDGFKPKDTVTNATAIYFIRLFLAPFIVGNILEETSFMFVFFVQAGVFLLAGILVLWAKEKDFEG